MTRQTTSTSMGDALNRIGRRDRLDEAVRLITTPAQRAYVMEIGETEAVKYGVLDPECQAGLIYRFTADNIRSKFRDLGN